MSDQKISAFTAGAPAVGTDLTLIARAGSSLNIPLSDLIITSTFSAKTTSFTAAKNNIYALNANALTVTFPASPVAGDSFQMFAATAAVAAFTTARNGSNINSTAADITVNNFWSVKAVFRDSTVGWILTWTPAILGVLDLSFATAGQIKFPSPATNLSADANTLDAYAEGTWTPVLKFGGATTGITYNFQTGNYTRIGRVVHLFTELQLTNKGSATGSATIAGIPFSNAGAQDGYIVQHMLNMGAGLTKNLAGYISGDMQLVVDDGAGGAANDGHFTNTSLIQISVVYRT